MTAPFEMSLRAFRPAAPQLWGAQADTLRVLLLADKEALTAEVAQHAATLDALSVGLSADTTSLDRAMTALHMYEAREAIEEVDEALARMEPDRAGPPLTAMRRVIQDAATS